MYTSVSASEPAESLCKNEQSGESSQTSLITIFMKGGLTGHRMLEHRFESFIVSFCAFLNVDTSYTGLPATIP